MKAGQTTFVVFSSKILSSALGFVATIYVANELGPAVLGIYAVLTALASWLVLGGRAGVSNSMIKRISEGANRGAFLSAGTVIIAVLVLVEVLVLLVLEGQIAAYVGPVEQFSSFTVVVFLIAMIVAYILFSLVSATLQGEDLVHIDGLLKPVNIGTRSLIQISLVLVGFGLTGLLVGYIAGLVVATVIGTFFVSILPRWPSRRHFRSLLDYAKFSWIGGLKSRAFNNLDILVLGFFVPQTLIGIYSVAWSLATFLNIFSTAISDAMFPKISNISNQQSIAGSAGHIEDSIAYGGFISIPGVVGGVFLSDLLLRIYGPEFTRGVTVLWLLLASILIYGYMQLMMNALNAIDRPDTTFAINTVFIGSNAFLNVVLIREFGWVGAAIASVLASSVGLVLAFYLLRRTVSVEIPAVEIAQQLTAAAAMGAGLWLLRDEFVRRSLPYDKFTTVLFLVGIGIAVYFGVMLAISPQFRSILERNVPQL